MTTISHSKPSLEASSIAANGSLTETPSSLPSAQDSLATNKNQFGLRKSIIADSKEWKRLHYTPSTTRSVGFPRRLGNLDSKVKSFERKIMDDMSHLTNKHNYNIDSICSIAKGIPKYSKDVPRQLAEFLSEQDDVPTFDEAITETQMGGAFVELNWDLKEVKRDWETKTDQATSDAEVAEPDDGSIAVVWNGGDDSDNDNVPYRPRRISEGGREFEIPTNAALTVNDCGHIGHCRYVCGAYSPKGYGGRAPWSLGSTSDLNSIKPLALLAALNKQSTLLD